MNLVTTISPFLRGCKSFILWGGREIKINCMHIEYLFLIGNVQIIRKCKTGAPVNHKQLTNALRHAIMFLWACFTTHSLRCLSFWKLVIRLTVQSNMCISVQLAMKSQLSWSLLFSLFVLDEVLKSLPWYGGSTTRGSAVCALQQRWCQGAAWSWCRGMCSCRPHMLGLIFSSWGQKTAAGADRAEP